MLDAMPELPEVETVRRGLEPALKGRRLDRVVARRPDLRFPLPEGFGQRLTGATVERLERRAKYLRLPLSTGETLVIHLGMTGRFEIEGRGDPERPGQFRTAASHDDKHAHVVFETDTGGKITYFDPRRFGFMDLIATAEIDTHPWFAGLGPEPLGPAFNPKQLAAAIAGKRQNIKATLLDQHVVAGLGNIYVCEALWRARISPLTAAGRISAKRLALLVETAKTVLVEAVEAGGSTLRDYAGVDGELGYFQHDFRAYGRERQPCLRDGCRGVIKRIVQAGRSTFYCPACQR